ncbi:hypothetical protein HDV05_000346 [Chytridiales sp. JEL 0842]|nr:hypothetical protein HDV05_000346 [Chytridiales sp. JEL 0842]
MDYTRWQRILMNDLENIPIGLLVAWGSAFSPKSVKTHIVLVMAFAALRCGHTWAYAKGVQPWRSLCWFGGVLSVAGLGLNGLLGAFLG